MDINIIDTDIIIIHGNLALCKVDETERLKQFTTIGRLLNELQSIYQHEQLKNPDSQALKDFKKDLDLLEKEYRDEIPKIVADYQKEYQQAFIREKLAKAEDQYKKLVNWTDDVDNPGAKLRQAIQDLREQSYNDAQRALKDELEYAWNRLEDGKCYRDQAVVIKQRIAEQFEYYKKYKEQVTTWFKDLDDLYKKSEVLLDAENYKALYAYRLEFNYLLREARKLKQDEAPGKSKSAEIAKDHEWLKRLLTQYLWHYCMASYETFYWNKIWVNAVDQEKRARSHYKTFVETRRDKFIREAQDITLDREGYDDDSAIDNTIPVAVAQQPEKIGSGRDL